MRRLRALLGDDTDAGCRCRPAFERDTLVLDATDCDGDLATAPECRETAVDALGDRDAAAVVVRSVGRDHRYDDATTALLVAAGRFAPRVRDRDARLAALAGTDPLAAAREATGRAGSVADIAAETGLDVAADGVESYDAVRVFVGLRIAHARVDPDPPAAAALVDAVDLSGGATARRYDTPNGRTYHVEPPETAFDEAAYRVLDRAHDLLADGVVTGDRAATRAADRAAGRAAESPQHVAAVLKKHARGYGVLDDLFADTRITDVYASAPAADTRLRVVLDGRLLPTNVRLTSRGVDALASRVRAASGRPFSPANPTLDAVLRDVGAADRVRVAAVSEPVADGVGFAFRAHSDQRFTLPRLVETGTLTPDAAALLSVAVERGAAVLVAGARAAGKTTFLGALLWELPPDTRTVVIEDAPELPIPGLQSAGRDVQALRATADGDGAAVSTAAALRTALRLGEGALAVGEVRGAEAGVLYEAMRTGAGASAVLGTIHGDGGASVRERVVSDLGVPANSFAATDLVVTLADTADGKQVVAVEEFDDGFHALFERTPDGLQSSGRVGRGESSLVASLAAHDETYADVRAAVADRTERFR
ncbi:type II/IV secretion system ATPase subunit [Salarchaeum sp. JOR-1]|uniref:type II/IV secretion system ATPase subunit n=1 Tax=Salarchaeum sp. JOR-1 TaxID=2599399 RepID=UPI001198C417|nr:type II/IV secretion system ATPase subunit [Salarchaeum sp. JOR-1]QDX39797.1 type II/IV secretion system ATPase subunit [Salarchaeum sp. JOR-1]